MTTQTLIIRNATTEDAEVLAHLAEHTFRDAFASDNTPDDLEAYVREAFSVETVRRELEDDTSTFLIAVVDGREEPIGYAKLRSGAPGPGVTGQDPVELQRIYVDQSAIGQGLGAALMAECLDAARAGGHRTLWLGVWERNDRAIAFYEKWGFDAVGSHVFTLGSDDQTDLIMQRSL